VIPLYTRRNILNRNRVLRFYTSKIISNILTKVKHTHQLLAYADDVNILGGSFHTLKENAEALVAPTREIGLEVNADKTKYKVMSRDQNAG